MSTRPRPFSPEWMGWVASQRELRHQVFHRDGYRCRLEREAEVGACFGGLTPHHIVKSSAGGTYDLDNLVTLCVGHNRWVEDNPWHARELGLVRRRGE